MAATCNTSDILQSPVNVYVAAVGATEPADSVDYGGNWPSAWTSLGLTNAPLTKVITQNTNMIHAQQTALPAKEKVTGLVVTWATELLQVSWYNLFYATNGIVTATAAGAGQVGKDEIEFGGADATGRVFNLPERAWGFEALNEHGYVQRWIARKATSKSNGNVVYDRDNHAFIPIIITVLDPCNGSSPIYGLNVTAPATS